jgi:hypothetical protein
VASPVTCPAAGVRTDDDFTFSQIETADGWSGWVTAEAAAGGRIPGGSRRALHSWHVRWAMGQMDALVAGGEYSYCDEGDAIAMRPQTERH